MKYAHKSNAIIHFKSFRPSGCSIAGYRSFYMTFILLHFSYFPIDPSVFITAGDRFINPDFLPHRIIVFEESDGYDGQFYYRVALNPLTSLAEDFGVRIDTPPYRHQRILYPFLVWLASLGHTAWVFVLFVVKKVFSW